MQWCGGCWLEESILWLYFKRMLINWWECREESQTIFGVLEKGSQTYSRNLWNDRMKFPGMSKYTTWWFFLDIKTNGAALCVWDIREVGWSRNLWLGIDVQLTFKAHWRQCVHGWFLSLESLEDKWVLQSFLSQSRQERSNLPNDTSFWKHLQMYWEPVDWWGFPYSSSMTIGWIALLWTL